MLFRYIHTLKKKQTKHQNNQAKKTKPKKPRRWKKEQHSRVCISFALLIDRRLMINASALKLNIASTKQLSLCICIFSTITNLITALSCNQVPPLPLLHLWWFNLHKCSCWQVQSSDPHHTWQLNLHTCYATCTGNDSRSRMLKNKTEV